MIYAVGAKNDKSFNESASHSATKFKNDTGVAVCNPFMGDNNAKLVMPGMKEAAERARSALIGDRYEVHDDASEACPHEGLSSEVTRNRPHDGSRRSADRYQ